MDIGKGASEQASIAIGLAAALLLGGCGGGEEEPPLPPDELYNRIEALRVLREEPKVPPQRLGLLKESEIGLAFRRGRTCRLRRDDQLLLAAGSRGALARVDGQLRALAVSGPMLPSGAFFTAPGITVSIGRRAPVAAAAEAPGIQWRSGVTVGGTPKLPLQKFDASWTCR